MTGLSCLGIDHIHFYVDHVEKWGHWFQHIWGFQLRGQRRTQATTSLWLNQGAIHFILSEALGPRASETLADQIHHYRAHHPQGIADIAFQVSNLTQAYEWLRQQDQVVEWQSEGWHCQLGLPLQPGGYQFRHSLIERPGPVKRMEPILPGFELCSSKGPTDSLVSHIDHMVLNVPVGTMGSLVEWYQHVFNWSTLYQCQIETQRSGLRSQVVGDRSGGIPLQLAINEPIGSLSQIQEFVNANRGPGIQHIALHTSKILTTVERLRQQGLNFLVVPESYYQHLLQYDASLDPTLVATLARQQVLIDQVDGCKLLQIFTQPIFPEPTLFFELIQRYTPATGFGDRNFKALFEAMEQQQLQVSSEHSFR